MHRMMITLASLLLLAGVCSAQELSTSALMNKALDEQIKPALRIDDVLPRAMETIQKQTGVRLEADPIIWELLPWGQDTNIKATFENITLRQALSMITRKLGLTYELKDEYVQIQPMPALRRLARRSTVQELQALDLLASSPLDSLGGARPTIKQLLEAVDKRLADLKPAYAIENRTADTVGQDKQVFVPRNATLMEAMEAMVRDTNATWYPWGKIVVVSSKEDRTRAQLARTITVRYAGQDVLQVLMELQAKSGVHFDIQAGAIQQVAPDARNIRGMFENASVQQILEAISGTTGLTYIIKDDEVVIENPAARPAGAPREPMIGLMQLDVGIQVLVPQSQVPADVREYLKYKTAKEIEKIRQRMEEEGFKPATRPATKPVEPNRDL